jgi:hypothetical protein
MIYQHNQTEIVNIQIAKASWRQRHNAQYHPFDAALFLPLPLPIALPLTPFPSLPPLPPPLPFALYFAPSWWSSLLTQMTRIQNHVKRGKRSQEDTHSCWC